MAFAYHLKKILETSENWIDFQYNEANKYLCVYIYYIQTYTHIQLFFSTST